MKASDDRPGRRPPTLEEVAAHAGVGRGTASRVVNGGAHVSEAAREAVLRAVEELGYVPNRAARSLVTRLTDSVALVVSESEERFFGEPFFAGIVRSASAALTESGRQLFLTVAQSDASRSVLENHLTRQHVDGVLLLSIHGDDPLANHLEERGLPTVFGGRPAGQDVLSYVDIDNVAGAEEAVRHLVAAGRRRIGTITGPGDMMAGVGRLEGYRRALRAAGLPYSESLVAGGDFSEASGAPAAEALLVRCPDLDAVFAASDPMAYAVLRVLAARGLRVPEDVAVIGFDDAPSSKHTVPLLTTVHQPVDEMGREMVRLLVARIEHRPVDLQVTLAPRLVVRESA
jgi:DNA-binding LacI/PurR family transcriptional regulator